MWNFILRLFGLGKKTEQPIPTNPVQEEPSSPTVQEYVKRLSDIEITDKIREHQSCSSHPRFLVCLLDEQKRRKQAFKDYLTYLDIIDNESLLRLIYSLKIERNSSIEIDFLHEVYRRRKLDSQPKNRKLVDTTVIPEFCQKVNNDISLETTTRMMQLYLLDTVVDTTPPPTLMPKAFTGGGGTFDGGGATGDWDTRRINPHLAHPHSMYPEPTKQPPVGDVSSNVHCNPVSRDPEPVHYHPPVHTPSYHEPRHSHTDHSNDSSYGSSGCSDNSSSGGGSFGGSD